MDPRRVVSPESALASDIFDKFCSANTLKAILSQYRHLCSVIRIKPTHFPDFYPRLKAKLSSWRAQGLWSKFEKRASHKCYSRGKACYGTRVLIIGAGPCGLRAAIEAQLLGAKVVLVEKRDRFSRNNVLHLWPFVITDLKALGAKKFYGKFCAGSIDHISIRQLQCILLKVALLLGVEIHEGVGFEGLREATENEGWRATTSPADHPVCHYNFDVLIGADGRRNTLDGFKRKALRAKLAIAITANFINKHTEAEARVKEISGVSYIFNQKFFQDLNEATGIDLENIVYYKDETHYFVMTAKKQSLLSKGVLLQDHADTARLLSHENISSEALMYYALEAARFSTENQLPNLEFAVNHYGQPDVAMFDFTAMYAAENACRVVQRKGHKLLMTLVGDSLLEPFWPTGSGCARGFLSSFDACWMLRSWTSGIKSMLEVIAERESIYRLLGQTTPENLNKEHMGYTIDPHSRYPNLNLRVVMPFQVKSLYDSDEKIPDVDDGMDVDKVSKKRRRDSVIAVDSLLSWLRDQVMCYGLEVSDVRDAFVRGDVLSAIIHRFRPDLIEFPLPSEENVDPLDTAAFRNQAAFDLLHEEYGLTHVMSGFDSVQCPSSDFLSLVAYLSQIYEIFRGEIPQIKYPRVESNDELDEQEQRSSHSHPKYNVRPAVVVKHGSTKPISRRNRLSSSGRDSRDGDSETSRRHKKRRSDERSRGASGREIKTTLGASLSGHSVSDSEKHVPGLARDLEEKLKGSRHVDKKPKDLVRAIGKIEKSDWNVQLIEKKIAENKGHSQVKKDREDKVPRWSREAFDDKREAMKRKMEGASDKNNDKLQLFEETVKKLGNKLKEGNALEVGQRGCNKVSQMAEQLVHKLERPKEAEVVVPKATAPRPVFEFPKKGGSESCHFCTERVYVVERMTAEGKFFHRNCFRCEYCNTSLRVGNYVFDREGRYGERFYCTPHHQHVRLNGWKKYDQEGLTNLEDNKYSGDKRLVVASTQQILSEMDERGTTPERVEFENSVDFASEEELLSEMDEDEWTDRNFGASNADNNTSDEASDLSDDDDITPEGNKQEQNQVYKESPIGNAVLVEEADGLKKKDGESSDSDTEVASGEVSEEEGSCEEEEEEEEDDEEEEEEECGGSTTEIETDSEFAEDPPHSVPGKIPTIVVDEPEQLVTRLIESVPLSHTQTPPKKEGRGSSGAHHHSRQPLPPKLEDLNQRVVEPVKMGFPERPLPRVTAVPKEWVPLRQNSEVLASKMSLELKKKYLHGVSPLNALGTKKTSDPTAQNQFRSVLDMISEQQKLLQPAAKHSATMQAILDGAEKLKNKPSISPIGGSAKSIDILSNSVLGSVYGGGPGLDLGNGSCSSILGNKWSHNENESVVNEGTKEKINVDNDSHNVNTLTMNRLNLEKSIEASTTKTQQPVLVQVELGKLEKGKEEEEREKGDCEKEIEKQPDLLVPVVENSAVCSEQVLSEKSLNPTQSELSTPSVSQSETESQSTIIDTNRIGNCAEVVNDSPLITPIVEVKDIVQALGICPHEEDLEDEDSDTETGTDHDDSDIVDIDEEDEMGNAHIQREPPRVEIEDVYGITRAIDVDVGAPARAEKLDSETQQSDRERSSESCQTQILHADFQKEEEEPSKSCGMSSSDSKDSLNSGVFLETELSDWVRDGDVDGGSLADDPVPKRKSLKKKQAERKKREQESNDKISKLKSNLALDLEGFAFMDVDGLSSPEDNIENVTRKQGYCKLADEDVDTSTPEFELENKKCGLHLAKFDDDDCDDRPRTGDSESSSRSSTPTIGSVSAAAPNAVLGNTIAPPGDIGPEKQVLVVQEKVVETINPVLKGKDNYTLLDRVVPFSNARDSLDYRKMKGISSPTKSKDLYSTYAVPSTTSKSSDLVIGKSGNKKEPLKPTVEQEYDEERAEEDEVLLLRKNGGKEKSPLSPKILASSSNSPLVLELQNEAFDGNKSSTSPNTARRIEEIQKERVKQSDLIRSMVMGRIRRSPEKGRKGSRGSLSPLGASSSSASASGSSEQVMSKSEEHEIDSRRSSQNSILSNSHEGDTTETDESHHNSSSNVDGVTSGEDSLAEPVPSSADVSQRSSSSAFSSDNNIPHNQVTGTTTSSGGTPRSSKSHHYEPVFTSSPRFRNRPKFTDLPKFDSPLKIYQSATNPPTPVHPPMYTPVTPPALTPNSDSSSSFNNKKGISPSFYRSMPDLTAFASGSPRINGQSIVYKGFATPNVQQWESYKTTSTADRENARKAARERARLKSDEELGLSPTDYINLKDKLRRKASVAEDDVFDPLVVAAVTSPTSSHSHSHSGKSEQGLPKNRPTSDVFDAVASSIRHNVDFPIKRNPFLVSPTNADSTSSSSSPKRKEMEQMSPIGSPGGAAALVNGEDVVSDDFVQLRLRITPKNQTPERKISPEKARSVGWDTIPDSFPNYFSPHSPTSCSAHPAPHSFTTTIRNDQNWLLERTNDTPLGRPRSNTMSELNLAPSVPGTSSSCTNCSHSVEESPLMGVVSMNPLPHSLSSPQSAARSASAAAFNSLIPNHSNTNNISNHLHATSHMPNMQNTTSANCKPKAKALSSDTLLDETPSQANEPFRGISVPDFTHENNSPERKLKKSKDRDRRRSLIQAVSDFFTSRSSSTSNSIDKGNGDSQDKSQTSTSTSSAGVSPSKDKFSLFKLTPKLLQSKEKRNSKSREMLASPSANQSGLDSSSKSPRAAGFISYLSQPEMVIQKLSSSPTPFKSSRANLNKLNDSGLDASPLLGASMAKQDPLATLSIVANPSTRNSTKNLLSESKRNDARRMREVHKIHLQLESIENEQRILEARGVCIEKKLRGEEPDDENREEAELMEEWFTLVREKTRLARFEKELLVRAEELELEERQERLEEQLDKSLLINDLQKSPEDKSREIRILHELKSLEKQRDVLVNRMTEDLKKYETEDADLEEKIASSCLSPRESNV